MYDLLITLGRDLISVNTLVAMGYFVLSVINDDLNVQWHIARIKVQPHRGGRVSVAMGIIGYLPYVLLLTTSNWQIIVADLAGNYVGSYFGIIRHGKKDDRHETENSNRIDGESPVGEEHHS